MILLRVAAIGVLIALGLAACDPQPPAEQTKVAQERTKEACDAADDEGLGVFWDPQGRQCRAVPPDLADVIEATEDAMIRSSEATGEAIAATARAEGWLCVDVGEEMEGFWNCAATHEANPRWRAREAERLATMAAKYPTLPANGRMPTFGDVECTDFVRRRDAQAVLDYDRSDPHHLDEDGDGRACELLPS
jgi:hypothetical protein